MNNKQQQLNCWYKWEKIIVLGPMHLKKMCLDIRV